MLVLLHEHTFFYNVRDSPAPSLDLVLIFFSDFSLKRHREEQHLSMTNPAMEEFKRNHINKLHRQWWKWAEEKKKRFEIPPISRTLATLLQWRTDEINIKFLHFILKKNLNLTPMAVKVLFRLKMHIQMTFLPSNT